MCVHFNQIYIPISHIAFLFSLTLRIICDNQNYQEMNLNVKLFWSLSQSLVLVSRLPYIHLFQSLLQIIAPEYFEKSEPCLEAGEGSWTIRLTIALFRWHFRLVVFINLIWDEQVSSIVCHILSFNDRQIRNKTFHGHQPGLVKALMCLPSPMIEYPVI